MPIIRSKTSSDFFVMHNATAQDNTLSWAARGMLCYLLSKPDGWKTNMTDLSRQTNASLGVCRKIFAELLEAKYAEREEARRRGKIYYDIFVYDKPCVRGSEMSGISDVSPHATPPHAVLPHAEKRHPYKEQSLENTDIERTDKKEPYAHFDIFWSMYPRKVGKEKARLAFVKATKLAPPVAILAGLESQLPWMASQFQGDREDFRPHPTTWLNGGRWDDEHGGVSNTDMADAALDEMIRRKDDAEQQSADTGTGHRQITGGWVALPDKQN